MDNQDIYPKMYTLTGMTGRQANTGRTAVVSGFEVRWRTLIVLIWSMLVALPVAGVFALIIGQAAIAIIPVVVGVMFFLIERRSSKGLKLRTYQSILSHRQAKSKQNRFYICASPITVGDSKIETIASVSVPLVPSGLRPSTNEITSDIADLFATPAKKPMKSSKTAKPAKDAPVPLDSMFDETKKSRKRK